MAPEPIDEATVNSLMSFVVREIVRYVMLFIEMSEVVYPPFYVLLSFFVDVYKVV